MLEKETETIMPGKDTKSVPDVCLRLGIQWFNWGFFVVMTVRVLRSFFIVSSQFVN